MRVHSLFHYPVKSCGGLPLQQLELDEIGPAFDRRWMIVGTNGAFVTQRQNPKMSQLKPLLEGDQWWLEASSSRLRLASSPSRERRSVRVWNSHLEAEDLGDEAAAFCSDFLQEEVRLVYMDSGCVRTIAQEGFQERQVSFADGYPLLITTLESLEALNQKLEEPVPMNRFRPNIVLEGATPWEEHRWKKLMIGDLELTLAKACTRCAMITIEQETGLRRSSEPLRQLFQEPGLEGKAVFGENAVHAAPGVLRVGQEVTVLG